MPPLIVSAPEEWDDVRYAAEMAQRQFRALRIRLHPSRTLDGIRNARRILRPRRRSGVDQEVRRWLFNGWNTENLIRLTSDLLKDDQNASALHWSFPQAYYSAFAITFAFFKAAGYTETSHASVIKKFGNQVLAGEYPDAMSFYATGTMEAMTVHGIDPTLGETSLSLNESDPASVDKHISQFLKGTRRQALDDRRAEMKFRTAAGKPKQRLSQSEWERVSDAVGPTSVLSLLYRKRIQANYRDIESIAFSGANAARIHEDLPTSLRRSTSRTKRTYPQPSAGLRSRRLLRSFSESAIWRGLNGESRTFKNCVRSRPGQTVV